MERLGLKKEYIRAIRKTPILFGEVAQTLAVTPGSLMRLLTQNHQKLTVQDVENAIRRNMKVEQGSDLFETIKIKVKKDSTKVRKPTNKQAA